MRRAIAVWRLPDVFGAGAFRARLAPDQQPQRFRAQRVREGFTVTLTGATSTTRSIPIVAHALFLVALLAASVIDLLGGSFVGPMLIGRLATPMVALVIGTALAAAVKPGGRPILLAADAGALIGSLAVLSQAAALSRFGSGSLLAAGLVLVPAALALLSTTRIAPAAETTIQRRLVHRVVAVVLLALVVITAVAPAVGVDGTNPPEAVLASLAIGLTTEAVALVVWWFGIGWLLSSGGAISIAAAVSVVLLTGSIASLFGNALLIGIVAVIAGFRPPRDETRPNVSVAELDPDGSAPGGLDTLTDSIRPSATAVWLGLGMIPFIPTVLIGRFPPVLVDCFDQCPAPSPLAGPSMYVDLLAIVLVPLAALVLIAAPTSRQARNGSAATVGLVGSVLVLIQVVLGVFGTVPFTYMGTAGPPAVLLTVAFACAHARPRWLHAVGNPAGLAAGAVALDWMYASSASGSVELPVLGIVGLGTGIVVLLGLAQVAARAKAARVDARPPRAVQS